MNRCDIKWRLGLFPGSFSRLSSSAVRIYTQTAQIILQPDTGNTDQRVHEINRLLPQLRQLLSCAVCCRLLTDPYSPIEAKCQHNVCRLCVRGRKCLRPYCPSCRNCQDYKTYKENKQMTCLLQCYKGLCELLKDSPLFAKVSKTRLGPRPFHTISGVPLPNMSIQEFIVEGAAYDDEGNAFQEDLPRPIASRLQLQMPAESNYLSPSPTSTAYDSGYLPTPHDFQMTPNSALALSPASIHHGPVAANSGYHHPPQMVPGGYPTYMGMHHAGNDPFMPGPVTDQRAYRHPPYERMTEEHADVPLSASATTAYPSSSLRRASGRLEELTRQILHSSCYADSVPSNAPTSSTLPRSSYANDVTLGGAESSQSSFYYATSSSTHFPPTSTISNAEGAVVINADGTFDHMSPPTSPSPTHFARHSPSKAIADIGDSPLNGLDLLNISEAVATGGDLPSESFNLPASCASRTDAAATFVTATTTATSISNFDSLPGPSSSLSPLSFSLSNAETPSEAADFDGILDALNPADTLPSIVQTPTTTEEKCPQSPSGKLTDTEKPTNVEKESEGETVKMAIDEGENSSTTVATAVTEQTMVSDVSHETVRESGTSTIPIDSSKDPTESLEHSVSHSEEKPDPCETVLRDRSVLAGVKLSLATNVDVPLSSGGYTFIKFKYLPPHVASKMAVPTSPVKCNTSNNNNDDETATAAPGSRRNCLHTTTTTTQSPPANSSSVAEVNTTNQTDAEKMPSQVSAKTRALRSRSKNPSTAASADSVPVSLSLTSNSLTESRLQRNLKTIDQKPPANKERRGRTIRRGADRRGIQRQNSAAKGKAKLIRRGCHCGNSTVTPGKLTCCAQRCSCYADQKPCTDCGCRGCRNPHRADGTKHRSISPEIINFEIEMAKDEDLDEANDLIVETEAASTAAALDEPVINRRGGNDEEESMPASDCSNGSAISMISAPSSTPSPTTDVIVYHAEDKAHASVNAALMEEPVNRREAQQPPLAEGAPLLKRSNNAAKNFKFVNVYANGIHYQIGTAHGQSQPNQSPNHQHPMNSPTAQSSSSSNCNGGTYAMRNATTIEAVKSITSTTTTTTTVQHQHRQLQQQEEQSPPQQQEPQQRPHNINNNNNNILTATNTNRKYITLPLKLQRKNIKILSKNFITVEPAAPATVITSAVAAAAVGKRLKLCMDPLALNSEARGGGCDDDEAIAMRESVKISRPPFIEFLNGEDSTEVSSAAGQRKYISVTGAAGGRASSTLPSTSSPSMASVGSVASLFEVVDLTNM